MTETVPGVLQQKQALPGRVRSVVRRGRAVDVTVATIFLVAGIYVMSNLWRNLKSGYLYNAGRDQAMWEWFFADTAHALAQLHSPLVSSMQNAPVGVNLMANTAMFGVSVPLAPVTLIFGPTATYAVSLTLGLSGSAIAWYWLFSRHVMTGVGVRGKIAAAVGAGFCGFAPAMISHANGHPNFVSFFVLPFIFILVVRVSRGTRPIRDGVILGLLLAWQIFLGEEPLLIFAMSATVFAAVYALSDIRSARLSIRTSVPGLAVGAAVALAITAIPLWSQFFGQASYDGVAHGKAGYDAGSLVTYPTASVAGDPTGAEFRMNPTEENSYFGWPLVLVLLGATAWLWRIRIARAAAAVIVVMGVLSLGSELIVDGTHTGITLPWKYLAHLPLFESILESRLAMGAIPAIGLLLVLGTYRAFVELRSPRRTVAVIWLIASTIALVPLIPTPVDADQRSATPTFITSGLWEDYISDGTLVTVPVASADDARALTWQVDADFGFPIAGGYFVGPQSQTRAGIYGPEARPTSTLLVDVTKSGKVPTIDAGNRADALTDLRYWRADVLVLPRAHGDSALHQTVDELVGFPAVRVNDVWVWDVRDLVGGKTFNR
ncbi:hypothetical protein ABH922_004897 [Rhodococcus sp. 27YEA15]|uniref:glycosyl transferase n=1 Tax=Rhodococcus sp. 27YEA15 TaxID=3156259 RepID=UPI003C7A7CDA